DHEVQIAKQFFWLTRHLLPVLQRTCRMIRNGQPLCVSRRGKVECEQVLADVLGETRYALRLRRIGRISAQQVPVILHSDAAAGDGDQDGIEPLSLDLAGPG